MFIVDAVNKSFDKGSLFDYCAGNPGVLSGFIPKEKPDLNNTISPGSGSDATTKNVKSWPGKPSLPVPQGVGGSNCGGLPVPFAVFERNMSSGVVDSGAMGSSC